MATTTQTQKMEVDYSTAVNDKIPECEKLAKAGKLTEALDSLLALEKQTRTGSDAISTGRLLVAIVKLCYEAKKWNLLNENLLLATKKRGQLKQAVTKMVQEAYTYVEKTPNMETKLKLIDTLRNVTAGKIYVEIERARLTRTLAKIKEEQGEIAEAASILQELQVETFGSMDKKEKVEFILEQMRLGLLKKDYIRTQITSKKIATKFFDEKDTHELKLKFYDLMVKLDLHDSAYLAVVRHYRAVLDTDVVKEDVNLRNDTVKSIVIYEMLAPFDNEQADLVQRTRQDKVLDDLPLYSALLDLFLTNEIMNWRDFVSKYEAELRGSSPGTNIFNSKTEDGNKRWTDLKNRVVEHNIRVMAKYYTRVRVSRMSELLDLSDAETEEFLSAMVVSKAVEAKFDRLDGTVVFRPIRDPIEVLSDWSRNVSTLMHTVNRATHLINKEEMVHRLV